MGKRASSVWASSSRLMISVSTTDVGVLVKVPRWLLVCDHEEGGEGEHRAEPRGSHFGRCHREHGESRSP